MSIRSFLDLTSKEKIKKERERAALKFAVGMGVVATLGVATGILYAPKSGKETREGLKRKSVNIAESIKETVQKKVETVKDSAAHAEQEVSNIIKDVHEKTEGVKKEIKDGCHEISQDIHKTGENISNELNKSVK